MIDIDHDRRTITIALGDIHELFIAPVQDRLSNKFRNASGIDQIVKSASPRQIVSAHKDQPDPARLDQLFPACRVQAHAQPAALLRQLAHHPLVAQTASLEMEGVPPQAHYPYGKVASDRSKWDRGIQPGSGDGHPLSLPRQQDSQPIPAAENSLTAPDRGEPGAWQHARRVRRAARGNGAAAMPTPRPGPTQPPHRPSCSANAGWVQRSGHQIEALQGGLLGGSVESGLSSSYWSAVVDGNDRQRGGGQLAWCRSGRGRNVGEALQ
jgi:hypothetical protein